VFANLDGAVMAGRVQAGRVGGLVRAWGGHGEAHESRRGEGAPGVQRGEVEGERGSAWHGSPTTSDFELTRWAAQVVFVRRE
jgi:hypothetical protein